MTLPPPAATDAQVPTPAPELARVTAQRDAAWAANHEMLGEAAVSAERIAGLEDELAEREQKERAKHMSTLRAAALAAYQRQEQAEKAARARTLENLSDKAALKLRTIIGAEPAISFAERGGATGLVTTIEGIEINATFDNWADQTDVILLARVWTNDDGMQWMPFLDLADLGYLLTEDTDRPDDWATYKDETAVPA